jgi:hypothetical protein
LPTASIRPDRNARPDKYVLAAALQQNQQKLAVAPDAEIERTIAVLQALLDGTPLPRHLGVPIVSFDGSVSFAEKQ